MMAECKHIFIGMADGVHCTRCGLKLSPAEYAAIQTASKPGEKKTARIRKKVTTNE